MKWSGWILGSALCLAATAAYADVSRQGVWPSEEKKVSLDLEHTPRNAAVQELADQAGWSIVAQGIGTDPVDVHVKDIPANKVLDLLLVDSSYTANRDGTLISVVRSATGSEAARITAPAIIEPPPAVTAPPAVDAALAVPAVPAPIATVRGEDRKVSYGSLKIAKDEIVHDVSVVGGSLDVYGTVTGKVSVAGGSVRLREGSHVMGDVTAMGGSIHIEDNAVVDGDVGVVGGSLHRGEKSKIGGAIEIGSDEDDHHGGFIHAVGEALTQAALLFVLGAVFFTLAGRRMESLQAEIASRPMRSFALGIVGIIGFAIAIVALCVTVIGIPVALLMAPLAALAVGAAFTAALATVGRALVRHKSDSVYVHLAAGCALYLVAGHLPFVGGLVTLALFLMGIGTLVTTRLGGLWPGKAPPSEGPYRTVIS